MTDRNPFEAMLEAVVNEDHETAKEIFHNIVVAKAREIYEELLAEDFDLSEESEEKEEEDEKCDENVEEAFGEEEEGEEEEEEEEEGEEEEESGDVSDEFASNSEADLEDRVLDIEDALEELRAEFEELMADERNEPEHDDMFGGEEDEFSAEPESEMGFGQPDEIDELAGLMEYVNKIAPPKHGDNGANAKSVVAGKNDMGGTTANIVSGGVAKGEGTQGGLLNPSTKEENFGNINVPGGKAGKTAFTHKEPGHGAEKKGAKEQAPNKTSIIGSK